MIFIITNGKLLGRFNLNNCAFGRTVKLGRKAVSAFVAFARLLPLLAVCSAVCSFARLFGRLGGWSLARFRVTLDRSRHHFSTRKLT